MPGKPTNADAYLAKLSADQRATLETVRGAIRAAAPDAEEGMTYGLPAFIRGKPIAGYGASANHCAYYPMSGAIVAALADDLEGYETSKGAIRFPIGNPLPAPLIRKLVKARLAEIEASERSKGSSAKPRAAKSRSGAARKPARAASTNGVRADSKKIAAPRDVKAVLRQLEKESSAQFRADQAKRFGIVTKDRTLGTPMAKIKAVAKALGRDHAFAEQLWKTRVYEARLLASMVDEPEKVTRAQMDRWAKEFDNWAVVDTLCFNLFDRSPHAFEQIAKWAKSRNEFIKRAAFALLASAALHKQGEDADFLAALPLVERAATDPRNFVKKGVSWALRAIGGKKSPKLRTAARALAKRLAGSDDATARWIGKDAMREFAKKA